MGNVDLTQSKQGSKFNHTLISNLEQSNVDLMQSKYVQESQVNHTPISNLEQLNVDLMQSIQGSQVNHTPISNHGQLNVDLMQAKPLQRPVRMNPTITQQPQFCLRVSFSEDVVCQEFSPKEKSKNLVNRKSNLSPLRSEKRSKYKPKPWDYDATDLVNTILDTKQTKIDRNNNRAIDNDC